MSAQTEPIEPMDTPTQAAKRQEKINRAAILARDAGREAMDAAGTLPRVAENKRAAQMAYHAGKAAREAANLLVEAGAIIPEVKARNAASERGSLDLSQLATLDTPDTRALLALMEQAQAVAERVDAARGHVVDADLPLQQGESRGTDLAESVSMLAARLRGEIFGSGVGRE